MKTFPFSKSLSMFQKNILLLFSFVVLSFPAFSQWSLTGNAGTSPGTDFLGSTDLEGLMFKVDNTQCGYIDIIMVNTSFGFGALAANSSGAGNVAIGVSALQGESSGFRNTAVGVGCLHSVYSSNNNTGIGSQAMHNNTGSSNTAIGNYSGINNNGSRNVFLGDSAGSNATTSFDKLFIGNGTNSQLIEGDFANDSLNLYANTYVGIPVNTYLLTNAPYLSVQGDMGCDGTAYASGSMLTSDERLKIDIQPLGSNALSKILQLNSKTYEFDKTKNPNAANGKQIGYLAQELNNVFPELVNKGGKYYAVNYVGLIPVLSEAMKEQQNTIDSLKNKLNSMEACVNNLCTALQNSANEVSADNIQQVSLVSINQAVLYQNTPNPFGSGGTKINYYLPQGTLGASIVFLDNYGNKLKEIEVSQTGMGTINIDGAQLNNGVYTYSLIINGQIVDTKKMEFSK